jgi:hypothetical protein
MFESKLNRGKAGGYAPLDGTGKVPLDKLPPIQSTIDTGSFAITGSNTFIGDQTISGSITTTTGIVQGTGSLYLQPDSNDSRYFQIYNTSPTDVHIKSNSGLSYFGDDSNYLKIDDSVEDITVHAHNDIVLETSSGDIIFDPDGGVYLGSNGPGNAVIAISYLDGVIGDTDIINNGTGNTITDNLTNIINSIPDAVDTGSFATTGSNSFTGSQSITGSLNVNGNQSITGSLNVNGPVTIAVTDGAVTGVANWNGQGGWNQGSYINITGSGGTGTGLTVDVSGGGGYIAIGNITINNPGTGYTNGDVITIDNENNLPGQFTVEVAATNVLQCDANGNLILKSNNAPSDLSGSIGDIEGTLRITENSIYFATQSFVSETYQITVNNGTSFDTHVSIPKNQLGVPELYSGGWTITTPDDTTYTLTGVYSDGDNWDCEINNLNSSYNGGTQTMTLTWLDYVATDIWKKIDFGFETGKFVENTSTSSFVTNSQTSSFITTSQTSSFITNLITSSFVTNSQTSSFVVKTNVPTSLTGSDEDRRGMIAFDSGALYLATETYYGPGPYTAALYQSTNSSPNFPITKGNFPKPKIGWTINVTNGFIVETITNVAEYEEYWLVYTNGGNSTVTAPTNVTLTTNGLLDNVWTKQEFISSSIINSLNSKTGSYATTGSNTFIGTETISGSLRISGSATLNNNNLVSSPNLSLIQTITSASYAALSPVSGTLYIIIG